MSLSRRAWIGGAASLLGSNAALAATPLSSHPAFRIWTKPAKPVRAPLSAQVADLAGESEPLRIWLDGRAALLIFWATWCTPCLAETPELNRVQQRLQAKGGRTVVRPVHAYDDANLADARAVLNRLGGRALDPRRASQTLELAGLRLFGQSPKEKTRTPLPALLLIRADGLIVGQRLGTPDPEPGEPPYWDDPRTLDMLVKLGTLA